ncbi:MAG: site-specific integrase, partial [Streptosporangiaceae bacterium]|nr:site-specific integrase [Streptosporangiaceae bacterium]
MARRGWGEDAVYWVARRKRYVGAASLGYGPDGRRVRRVVSGKTKQEVKDKLRALREELARSVRAPRDYTLRLAVQDWLSDGLDGRSPQTVAKYRNVLKPVLHDLGGKTLAELSAADVRTALARFAGTHSTETVRIARLGLERAIRYAEANDLVARNVAALVDAPKGGDGRPSKALSPEQAAALLQASRRPRPGQQITGRPRAPSLMHAYIVLCLLVGVRTEEARALRWDRLDLAGQPGADPPVPPSVAVWRSVRAHGDTKTSRSRRTLGLPRLAVEALRDHRESQD